MPLYDIMWHIFDGISHSRLSRLAKLLQFIPQSKLLSMIFLADEHLCRISIMSVCFGTNNVSLFLVLSLSFASLFSVKTHGCGRRAEGRGDAWAETQDVRRPGLWSFSGSLLDWSVCCLRVCLSVFMSECLCLFALPVWTLYRTDFHRWCMMICRSELRSQIRSTWGRVALNSDAKAELSQRKVLLLRGG